MSAWLRSPAGALYYQATMSKQNNTKPTGVVDHDLNHLTQGLAQGLHHLFDMLAPVFVYVIWEG